MATPTKSKRSSGGQLAAFSGGPPSPYTTRTQSMPVVAQYSGSQRTPPAAGQGQIPLIAPMYGTAAAPLQSAAMRRVQPPYRTHSYSTAADLIATEEGAPWAGMSEEFRQPISVDASDAEKGESPYAQVVAAAAAGVPGPGGAAHNSPRERQPTPDLKAAPLPTRGQRATTTSSAIQPSSAGLPPTPTRAQPVHQHSLPYSRTQQPSPPASTTEGSTMYYTQQHSISSSPQHHMSSSPSPPFKYDQHQGGVHRVPSKQLLNPGKTRTPDRSLPFKEEADNDDHDHHDQRQSHRLSGTWDTYDTEQGYGGLADDTAVDEDAIPSQPPQGIPASRTNLAELKNMSHHLQEPHEQAHGQDSSQSSGTPRSPTNGLPHGVPMHQLPLHITQMMTATAGAGGDTIISTGSSAFPMAHVAYDITTNQFDPEEFQQSTLAQLREPYVAPAVNGGKRKNGVAATTQHYPVYANPETIAAQLALQAQSPAPIMHNGHGHPLRPDAPEPPTPFSPSIRGTPYPYTLGMIGMEQQMAYMRAIQPTSDSAFSPATTPFPRGIVSNPFLPAHIRAASGNMTARSSPSHLPLEIAPGRRGAFSKKPKGKKRNWHSIVVPARGESTAPPETEYSGDEFTEVQTELHEQDEDDDGDATAGEYGKPGHDDEWYDVGDSDEEDLGPESGDMLEVEYHPRYVVNTERRKRKFEKKWSALVKAFREVDRTTDTTMVLMASPQDSHRLLALQSRSINRMAFQMPQSSVPSHVNTMRASFARLASHRRANRSEQGIAERFQACALEGALDGDIETVRGALQAALGSLSALGAIYEKREERWRHEMLSQMQDREAVHQLLLQSLGSEQSGVAAKLPAGRE